MDPGTGQTIVLTVAEAVALLGPGAAAKAAGGTCVKIYKAVATPDRIKGAVENPGGALVGVVARKGIAPAVRAKNIKNGIPESQLGPSGKPKIHVVEHSTQKQAKDAARAEVGKGGTTVKHKSPQEGGPHYHGQTQQGKKNRVRHEFPE